MRRRYDGRLPGRCARRCRQPDQRESAWVCSGCALDDRSLPCSRRCGLLSARATTSLTITTIVGIAITTTVGIVITTAVAIVTTATSISFISHARREADFKIRAQVAQVDSVFARRRGNRRRPAPFRVLLRGLLLPQA